MPVDQVVVGELGVVGDVREVLEDLLARLGDRRRDGERVHGAEILCGALRMPRAIDAGATGVRGRYRGRLRRGALVGDPHRVPELGAVHDRARPAAASVSDGHSSQRIAPAPYTYTRSPISGVRCSARSARAPRRSSTPAAQQRELELRHLTDGAVHAPIFGASRRRFLPAGADRRASSLATRTLSCLVRHLVATHVRIHDVTALRVVRFDCTYTEVLYPRFDLRL